MGRDVPFPYPYGSDLHWLWGWGHRIDLMLGEEGYVPSSHDWMTFRPCEPADDAMMQFGVDYPTVVADVKEKLEAAEAAFEKLCDNPSEQTEFVFADRVEVLEARIKKACELIAAREGVAVNPASLPQSNVRTRQHIAWDQSEHDDTVVEDSVTDSEPISTRNAKWGQAHALLDTHLDSTTWDTKKKREMVAKWNQEHQTTVGWIRLTLADLTELIKARRNRDKKRREKRD